MGQLVAEYPNLVLLLLVLVPVLIAILYWLREFVRGQPKRKAAAADRKRIKADYAGAGIIVKEPFFASVVPITASGTLTGVPINLSIAAKTKNSPGMTMVSMHSGLSGDFVISRESDADRYFKRVGFAIELQTGDAAFDTEFYLNGTSQSLFADAKNRDALRRLFDLGINRVMLHASRLSATSTKRHENLLLELPLLTEFVKLLASLRMPPGAMAVAMPAPGISTPQIGQICLAIAFAGAALFATAWFASEPLVNGWWPAVWRILPVAIAAIAILLGIAVALLKGRSAAHRELLAIVALALPSILFGGWGAVVLANQYSDGSEVRTHKTLLVHYYAYHSRKGGSNYYLVFESWHPGGGTVEIEVSEGQYGYATRTKDWIIRTHKGRLGFEWVKSIERMQK